MGQFEEFDNPQTACAVCEAMCPEAVDGTLSEAEQKAFDKHVAGCVRCAQELAEAQRGAAWMTLLKDHAPEPPAALLQRILAETTGTVVGAQIAPVPLLRNEAAHEWATRQEWGARPSRGWSTQWASLLRKLNDAFSFESARSTFQPRLAMTAAMAFFSIALTLNMTGVRLRDLRAGMLRPSSLRRTVADASASATRSFQNLRVVYEVESRVSDLRNNGGFGNGRFGNDQQDQDGPFENAPAASGTGSDSGNKSGAAAPENKPDANKPEKTVPQGKSELEFPVTQGTVAVRKGA